MMRIKRNIKNLLQHLNSANRTVNERLEKIENHLFRDYEMWHNQSERTMIENSFGDVMSMPDFQERYFQLISNLDNESVEIITKIILRQKKILHSKSSCIDLFSLDEKKQLCVLQSDFYDLIIKLSDEVYAYRSYLLPINHFEENVFYYKCGINSLSEKEKLVNKVFIDVGGFIGDSAIILSEMHPAAIYAFEPIAKNYELMQKTIHLNHLQNVVTVNCGLGDTNDFIRMHVSTGGGGSSIERRSEITYMGEEMVAITTLDNYVKSENINNIGLIKVDIEGAEQAFLRGAKETICKCKPILLISIYHNVNDFFQIKPLIEGWGLNYRFRIFKPTFNSVTAETILIAE